MPRGPEDPLPQHVGQRLPGQPGQKNSEHVGGEAVITSFAGCAASGRLPIIANQASGSIGPLAEAAGQGLDRAPTRPVPQRRGETRAMVSRSSTVMPRLAGTPSATWPWLK